MARLRDVLSNVHPASVGWFPGRFVASVPAGRRGSWASTSMRPPACSTPWWPAVPEAAGSRCPRRTREPATRPSVASRPPAARRGPWATSKPTSAAAHSSKCTNQADSAAGSVGDVVQVDVFEYRVEVVAGRIGLCAELRRGQLVFDVEHGLAVRARPRLQAGRRVVALVVLPALLVDREVEVRLQVAGLAEVVFQAHRESLAVRQVRDRGVELLLGGRADGQAGLVLVGIHVVELDRVQGLGLVQPRGELVDDELLRRLGLPVFGLTPETLVLMFSQNSFRKPPTGLPNRQPPQLVLKLAY